METSPLLPPAKVGTPPLSDSSTATGHPLADTQVKETPRKLHKFMNTLHNNKGLVYMAASQVTVSIMALITRFLSISLPTGRRYSAAQILFARMAITSIASFIWMWYIKAPHFPFGRKDVRVLLIIRGCSGATGLYGLYYSLGHLPLPDSTVITFLIPTCVSLFCSMIPGLKEPFTLTEKLGGVISLVGVVLIAKPTFLFQSSSLTSSGGNAGKVNGILTLETPMERLLAVGGGLFGVLGSSTAYTTIRVIGNRAYPLISVTYLSYLSTIMSLLSLVLLPKLTGGILIPETCIEWILLCGIGVSGFLTQMFLTKGFQLEKAGRGASLIYSQMLWATLFEWLVWGDVISGMSLLGAILIFAGVFVVNLSKWKTESADKGVEVERREDEEEPAEAMTQEERNANYQSTKQTDRRTASN